MEISHHLFGQCGGFLMFRSLNLITLIALLLTMAVTPAIYSQGKEESVKDTIRKVEKQRLKSLVDADIVTARRLHADDFQLISPDGSDFSKQQYLSIIESGKLDYKVWEPGEITVRLYGNVAVIRYKDLKWDVFFEGEHLKYTASWHTNLYEKRQGQWQVVWSQASQ
jgi:hypothetical protein